MDNSTHTLNGNFGSDVNVILNVTFGALRVKNNVVNFNTTQSNASEIVINSLTSFYFVDFYNENYKIGMSTIL